MNEDLPADTTAEQILHLILGGGTAIFTHSMNFSPLSTGGRSQQWKTLINASEQVKNLRRGNSYPSAFLNVLVWHPTHVVSRQLWASFFIRNTLLSRRQHGKVPVNA